MRSHHVRRKNYLPSLVITFVFWTFTTIIFFTVPPTSLFLISLFILLLVISIFFTSSLIFGNTRTGFFVVLGAVIIGIIQKAGYFSPIATVIVIAALITLNLLFKKDE